MRSYLKNNLTKLLATILLLNLVIGNKIAFAIEYDENGFAIDGSYQEASKNSEGVYGISNIGQLYWFAQKVNDGILTNEKVYLLNDIKDNSIEIYKTSNIKGNIIRKWQPIGIEKYSFMGEFNGAGHTIKGVYSNDNDEHTIGLFGQITFPAKVKNLTLDNCYFSGHGYIGGICAQNNGGVINNCVINNSILTSDSNEAIGGIVGNNSNNGIVDNCQTYGYIKGHTNIGGNVGLNNEGFVKDCYNRGNINGEKNIGGNVGKNEKEGLIFSCINYNQVKGLINIGGNVGHNEGEITNGNNYGQILGNSCIGGNIGVNLGSVRNCNNSENKPYNNIQSKSGINIGDNQGKHHNLTNIRHMDIASNCFSQINISPINKRDTDCLFNNKKFRVNKKLFENINKLFVIPEDEDIENIDEIDNSKDIDDESNYITPIEEVDSNLDDYFFRLED